MYLLHIGDKSYSSWSLRGWLLLRAFGVAFEEKMSPLYTDAFEDLKRAIAPARKVPALEIKGEGIVWDTLAIAETIAERHPEAGLWPQDRAARAAARSLAAEMHSGFQALRSSMSMNVRRRYPGFGHNEAALADAARVEELWAWARGRFGKGGPWLFGERFTAADAFYAPVVTRLETYGVPVSAESRAYMDAVLTHPAMVEWIKAAMQEPWIHARYEPLSNEAIAMHDSPKTPAHVRAWSGDMALRINVACPFSGKPVKADSLAVADGAVIGFCNPGCRDKFVADPAAYPLALRLLAGRTA